MPARIARTGQPARRSWYDSGLSRRSWRSDIAQALWPALFVLLANAPGRYALAMRERQFGQGVATLLGLALLGDVACLAPLMAVAMVPFDWLGATKAPMGWPRRATVAAAGATL